MPDVAARTAVFRADAAPRLGGGHVMRCLALAETLREDGWDCSFAVGPETLATVPRLADTGHRVVTLAEGAASRDLLQCAPDGCDLLVVDHYGLDAEFEAACRPWARRILAIDDLADRRHDCDLLLDQTLGRHAGAYKDKVGAGTRLLLGPAYALLRPEFAAARAVAATRRKSAGLARVLVAVGLTDPDNATGLVLQGIAESSLPLKVDVVLGPSAPHRGAVEAAVQRLGGRVRLHVGVGGMTDLMAAADFAFGAAGTSAWERAALGLPTALFVLAENQQLTAAALAGAGAAITLGTLAEATPAMVNGTLDRLAAEPGELASLGERAAAICDGRGCRRVAMALLPERTPDGRAVELRPATAADSDLMLEWQSMPEVRRFSRNTKVPTRPEHEAWLAAKLIDPGALLSLITLDDETVGVLRLDRCDERSYEVSILVAPAWHGQGIGKAALAAARRLVPEATIVAEVLAGNRPSHHLFRAAGFRPATEDLYIAEPLLHDWDPAVRRRLRGQHA